MCTIRGKKREKHNLISLISRFIATQINILKVKMPLHWYVYFLQHSKWKSVFKSMAYLRMDVALEMKFNMKTRWLTERMGWQLRDWAPHYGLLSVSYWLQALWHLLSPSSALDLCHPTHKSLHLCFSNSVVRDQFLHFSHSVADCYINEIQ